MRSQCSSTIESVSAVEYAFSRLSSKKFLGHMVAVERSIKRENKIKYEEIFMFDTINRYKAYPQIVLMTRIPEVIG